MLKRGAALLAVSLGLAAASLSLPADPAVADDGVTCPVGVGDCTITAGSSSPPSTGPQGGTPTDGAPSAPGCHYGGRPQPCYLAAYGWLDEQDGCYYMLLAPQPPAGTEAWQGHEPGDGAVYEGTCLSPQGQGLGEYAAGPRWFKTPPPGYGGAVNVAALAQQAVSKMGLTGPAIGIAPKPGGKGLVGLPVWLWDNVSPTTYGPNPASASAGGVTVSATGNVTQIAWDMGDGTTVTCTDAGTAYQPSFGNRKPDCGHVYTQTSAHQPGGAYPITATSTWVVDWTATTGQTGQITVTRQSTTSAIIGELQVLNHN